VAKCSAESFPVFPALLNAVHRKVTVRIITNNFGQPTCDNQIAPLDFLALNGVQIKYYSSTTFMHAKFLKRDGKVASISSINWTRNSLTNDREAGAIIEGAFRGPPQPAPAPFQLVCTHLPALPPCLSPFPRPIHVGDYALLGRGL
jgi:phosphatidylserine/phosphatidylglycerophosphate/cardiolipin synthase-like enzyme